MEESLQKAAFSGIAWKLIEKFSIQAFSFIQGVILARLLCPADYGLVAMTGVFFAISYLMADAGFSTALVQKKNRTELDYSTVFITNIGLSFLFCSVLCLCSSWIADFYGEPLLRKIVCVNALFLLMGSFLAVQQTRLSINLEFRKQSIINFVVTVVTGIIAIIMAFYGYGVWSLIYPSGLAVIIRGVLLWKAQHWWPKPMFSKDSFNKFFSFGSKIMLTALIKAIYNNLFPLIIGKKFTATDLGYYTRANGYAAMPADTMGNTLGSVSYPILSKIQDDDERLASAYRRMIGLSAYVLFPVMVGLAVLARPLVIVLVTDKWESCIVYLQILCFALMWNPIHSLNFNLLQTKGRADLRLKVEILQKVICIIMLFLTVPFGILYMCIGSVVVSFLCLFINTYYTGKLINVGFFVQMKDILPSLINSIIMGTIVGGVIYFISNMYLQLLTGVSVGIIYYIGISLLTKSTDYTYLRCILQENVLYRILKKS